MAAILRTIYFYLVILISVESMGISKDHLLRLKIPLASGFINFDPTQLYDQSSLWVSRHTNCQLSRKLHGRDILEAAKSLEYLNERKVKVLLNNNFKFTNGQNVTAEDVKSSIEFLKKNRTNYKSEFALVDHVTAQDKTTLVFHFKEPTARMFFNFFATSHNPIMPKSFLIKAEKDKTLLRNPIGCGKYQVSYYKENDHVTLESLDKSLPLIEFYLQGKNQITSIEAEKFDLVSLTISDLEKNKNKILATFRESSLFDPYHIVMGLNTTQQPWDNQKSRCNLFSKLVSKDLIEKFVPRGILALDLFPSGVIGYKPTSNYSEYYKSWKGELTKNKAENFCLSFVSASVAEVNRILFVDMIKTIYPNVEIKTIENPKNFGPTFLNQNCDGIIIGFKSNNLDGSDFLSVFSEKSINYTGYWNKDLERQIADAQSQENLVSRAQSFQRISGQIKEQCLIYPIITVTNKIFYIKQSLEFPDLEKSVLNEYFLGGVVEK